MPMIDVYAARGTFADPRAVAQDVAQAVMRWEGVPEIALFLDNTAGFVHELDPAAFSDAAGSNAHIRVNVLTPVGILDRDKKLGVTRELTDIVVAAATQNGADQGLADRTWVLISETPDGGWGLGGHAHTNAEITARARRDLGLE